MTISDIGPLTGADEGLNHQIADTFATVSESDRGWTEKIWGSISRKDGGLQIAFGLGKYANRNVMDAFGGVSQGYRQWTVRTSRSLAPDRDLPIVGPIRYEVIEPLKKVRFALDANDVQPISFDIVQEGTFAPFFEARNRLRSGGRIGMDVIRYHQPGEVSGWLRLGDEHHVVDSDWFGLRDHSWGMRGDGIGAIPADIQPNVAVSKNMRLLSGWCMLTRPDGTQYAIQSFLYVNDNWSYYSGIITEEDGSQQIIAQMIPDIRFDPKTRVFRGGSYQLHMASGEVRRIEVEGLGDSGFYLRTGQYGGWKGGRHGAWMGSYHEDGEYLEDCREHLWDLGQFRDKPLRVREGDAQGYGLQESIYSGIFENLGLKADSDFPSDV